jgi:hypothetical protein
MAAKKHQTQSDRSLGLLLDDEGKVVRVVYLNDLPMQDPDLDALGDQIGLMSAEASRRPVPPSARRATRRLRGTHTKAKQRR